MVTEILLSTILTASVAGAGLLIAIYTLFAQLRNRIFERRQALFREKMAEFERTKQNLTPEESAKGIEQLKVLAQEIVSKKGFPAYLSYVKYVFAGYIVCAFFSFFWLIDVVGNPLAEFLLVLAFSLSTLGFFIVVWNAVNDIDELMKEEYEQLKREAKVSANKVSNIDFRGTAEVKEKKD